MTADLDSVIHAWAESPDTSQRIAHVEHVAEREAIHDDLNPPLRPEISAPLALEGVDRLYRHQVAAIESVRSGADTVIVAGTASGKSLGYQVPIAEAIANDREAAALLLYPTKALSRDQLRTLSGLGTADLVAAVYDGDTSVDDRRWIRRNANVILTNPDMLHVGILPNHSGWRFLLQNLRFVVVDELHVSRGVFGSHLANILRRLIRLAAHYGADPTFVFTSATIGNPGELAETITGRNATLIEEDSSPVGARTYVLWNPELEDEEAGKRANALGEATRVFSDLVRNDVATLLFARSRKAGELAFRWARDRLDEDHVKRIAPYRAGYLAEDRRRVEQGLASGELLGVTTTNALELGIDIGSLDAVVVTTFPGTISSFRQQTGRAGRASRGSLAVLVAGQDALDQYYVHHPDELFSREPEAAVVNPANPVILAAHLRCAAHELPLESPDLGVFGAEAEEIVTSLVADGSLGIRAGRVFWPGGRSPASGVDIRSSGGALYTIVDDQGRLIGSVDEERAFAQCHRGAVYLHQGDEYLVQHLDIQRREVEVSRRDVGFYTQPKIHKDLAVTSVAAAKKVGLLGATHGTVEVTTQVIAYQRKDLRSGSILDTNPLDLPQRRFSTQAVWFTIADNLLAAAAVSPPDLPGTLHAIEHAAIGMLPLFAICDRWDVGGLSTAFHPDVGSGVFFIYDGYPGGIGIAPLAFDMGERLLQATLQALRRCPCNDGCPSCVQSPKCGNFNEPLSKAGAIRVLTAWERSVHEVDREVGYTDPR